MVAAVYLSRYNDEYYGQWLLMNKPFRDIDQFWRPEVDVVPAHLYYQTMAFLLAPEHWRSEDAIRGQLQLEAFRQNPDVHRMRTPALFGAKQL